MRILLCFFIFFITSPVAVPPLPGSESITVQTLYSAAIDPANGVHPLWTPVQHRRGRTFVVVPDADLRPMVTQIAADGEITTVPLDPLPDYRASADGHNRFTMGIDPAGYLHIAGDMHGYAPWADTYVERYQRQDMMYWRSNRPLDVTGGFTFCGARGSATTLPGEEWGGDSRFFNDRAGVLFFSSRVRAFKGGSMSGSEPFIAYGIYRYDHTTGRWAALGGKPGDAAPGTREQNTVLYWEHTDAFEAYQTAPRFDLENRLHFAIAGKTAGLAGQGLIYACSQDGGATWMKADGTRIANLPLRGRDGEPGQGHLVARSPKVAQQSPVAVDRHGTVAVKVENEWRAWNGRAWTPITGEPGILGADGMVTADGGSQLVRSTALGTPPQRLDTGFGQVFSISELGLDQTGEIYAVGLPPGTNFTNARQMSVFRARFTPTSGPATMPTAPRIFHADADDGRVWLSWTPVAGANGYSVLRGRGDGPATVIARDVASPAEFCDTTAVNGATYTYQVVAVNEVGAGPPSPAITVTPQRPKPRAPLIRDALARNAHLIIRWMPLGLLPTSYTVKRSDTANGPWTTIATGITAQEYADTGLTNDRTYHYVVSATTAGGTSLDSAVFSAAPFRWVPLLRYRSIGRDDTGSAAASAENPPRESAAKAFDGNRASKWLMSSATGSLDYRFAPGESWVVTRYRLISGQDAPERDPRDWRFQGSMDGRTWVTLDTRTDQAFPTRNGIVTCDFANTTAYAAYRLLITRNNGNGLTQLAELELWMDGKPWERPTKR